MVDISNAEIGYNKAGIDELKNKIHTEVIDAAKTELGSSFSKLEEALKEMWVGQSADIFLENMRKDMEGIKGALDDIEDKIDQTLEQVKKTMAGVDKALVKKY